MDFRIISGKTVHRFIQTHLAECIRVVKDAYLARHHGATVNPNSYFLRLPAKPDARIIALPAFVADKFNVAGIKWIASYPGNIQTGLPRASAVIVLNDITTGYPFACLEGSIISAARTAASAALAAEALNVSHRSVRILGIVGTGLIARYIYQFMVRTGWRIESVRLFDAVTAEAKRFRSAVCERDRHRDVSIAGDCSSTIREADLVIFATTAARPYVYDSTLFTGGTSVLHISLRDLAPAVILASQNVVDDVDHVMNAATSLHLAEQEIGRRSFVTGTLAGLLQGEYALDRSRPVIFSPFGLGILDLAVAKWIFDLALEAGEALSVPDFFFEMTR